MFLYKKYIYHSRNLSSLQKKMVRSSPFGVRDLLVQIFSPVHGPQVPGRPLPLGVRRCLLGGSSLSLFGRHRHCAGVEGEKKVPENIGCKQNPLANGKRYIKRGNQNEILDGGTRLALTAAVKMALQTVIQGWLAAGLELEKKRGKEYS